MASTDLRAPAQQALEAWDSTVLPKSHDGMMQERMENLRAALAEPAQEPDSPERRCGGPGCDGTCCQPVQEPLTDTYVQVVPDKCDRIVWRGHYFHLPVNSTSKPVQEPVEWSHINGTSDTKCHPPQRPAEPVQEPVADRAAFERHAERLGYSVDPDTREGREGGYWSSHTQLMWLTWQAALAEPVQDHFPDATKMVQEPVQETEMRRCPRCWEPMFPPQRTPLAWAERRALWRESTFRGNGGQMDWFIEGTRAAERAHGIVGKA